MDIRLGVLRVARRARRADAGTFGELLAALDADGAEVDESDRVAVGGLDRHRVAAARHGPSERDQPRRRRPDEPAPGRGDVDATMLRRGVRVLSEDEGS
jgi:hypothetical protein